MSQLEQRLSHLSAHERALAQAQMARAEAIADLAAGLVSVVRSIAGAVAAAGRSYTARLTRRWPHSKGRDEAAEFPSIGLQH